MQVFLDFVAEQWMLFAAFIVLSSLLIRSWVLPGLSGIKNVGVTDAVRMLNDDEALVLDVRLEKEYLAAHIKGSRHIPVGAIAARVSEISKFRDKPVLVTCQTGNRSTHAAQILKKQGFENVTNLSGGLNAWMSANMPVSSGKEKKKKSA